MQKIYFILVALFSIGFMQTTVAGVGDTTIVYTQKDSLVVTNPSTGWNPYPMWAVFPPATTTYRKVLLTLKYKCPSAIGYACGEWDYLDYVFMRRQGGVNFPSKNMEVARYITSYGNGNNGSWHAEWNLDITEYASLLHDSVEMEYQHTGYETNIGKGWLVTVQFTFIEGTPPCETVSIEQMWKGSFPFGNAGNPIENYLQPDTFTTDANTNIVQLKIVQSGHGYDANECAEFCTKTRTVYFDNALVNTRSIWRLCGTNPVFPQGGTWIYDRANWCPGSFVYPDKYNFNVAGGSTHIADVNMQAYTVASPSANYMFDAQKFEFKNPVYADDAAIEEVLQPNNVFEYSRMNPVCNDPKIKLRNNGNNSITSATIKYGMMGSPDATYNWTGTIDPLQSTTITLPGVIYPATGSTTFRTYLADVNGNADQYAYDDTAYTTALIPQVVDTAFVLVYKTNNIPSQTSFKFWDAAGNIVYQKTPGSMAANTIYRDTLYFAPGCYRFTLYDSGGDGLYFWANTAQGSGYFNFIKYLGGYIKLMMVDFGSEISFNFNVSPGGVLSSTEDLQNKFGFEVYPNPAQNNCLVNMGFDKATDVTLQLINDLGETVQTKLLKNVTADVYEFDLSGVSNGIYFLRLTANDFVETKKVVVKK